jgi:hypothetical protein
MWTRFSSETGPGTPPDQEQRIEGVSPLGHLDRIERRVNPAIKLWVIKRSILARTSDSLHCQSSSALGGSPRRLGREQWVVLVVSHSRGQNIGNRQPRP